jgi:hypothetical protein
VGVVLRSSMSGELGPGPGLRWTDSRTMVREGEDKEFREFQEGKRRMDRGSGDRGSGDRGSGDRGSEGRGNTRKGDCCFSLRGQTNLSPLHMYNNRENKRQNVM